MIAVRRASMLLGCSALLMAGVACSAPTITAFTVTASPVNINISPGGTAILTVAANSSSSIHQTAGLVIYSLPQGVSYSPTSPTVATGSQTAITLTAAPGAPGATSKVEVVGYAGLAGSESDVNVTVVPAS